MTFMSRKNVCLHLGKYIIEPGYKLGENSHILNATQRFGHASPVVLKFYFHDVAFDAEREFFSQRLAINNFIPQASCLNLSFLPLGWFNASLGDQQR